MSLLKDHQFHELCKILNINLQANDPDKKTIEKAFRKLALKTHPDKGGDPIEFKKINDAYNKLISHAAKIDAIEAEAELSRTSVIIEISRQAVPKWKEKLKACYGLPKTSKVNNLLFNGPYYQFSGKGRYTGPIVLVLYEDPEDKVPKILCRCDNYMAWIQEQKMPLHLHVGIDKNVMFDQWRIKSLAEFGFVSLAPGHSSARHDWKDSSSNTTFNQQSKEREEKEKAAREQDAKEKEAKRREEEQKRKAEEKAKRIAERLAKKKEEEEAKLNQPWWQKDSDAYQSFFNATPPPENGTKETNGKEDDASKEEPPIKIAKEEPKVPMEEPQVEVNVPNVEPEEPKVTTTSEPEVPKAEAAEEVKIEDNKPKEEQIKRKKIQEAYAVEEDIQDARMKLKMNKPKPPKVKPQEESKANPSAGAKKNLSGMPEKMLSKSKVKKVKTKKSVIKKASKADQVKDEEKENQGQQEEVKLEDVKATNTRKRPLEDIDVEDKKSQGQQGGKRANEETIQARGLSAEEMDLDNTSSKTEKQHQHDITQNNTDTDQAENDQQLPMDVVTNANNNHKDTLSCEDSPDLLKTLKTVKAIKKTLMKSPKNLSKKEANSKKKSNTTVVGIPEPSQITTAQQELPCIPDIAKEATTNNCQTNVVNSSAKEDGDPQQMPAAHVATAPPITAKTASAVTEDDGKADKEEHSFSENMSVCSDTPLKHEEEVSQLVGERADVATSESGLGHVSACQETNNYSLSYLDAAVVAAAITVAKVTTNSSTGLQLQPTSRNASEPKEKLLDPIQNDLKCREDEEKQQQQDNHVNDPTNNCQHTDIIPTTPQQQKIATPQNSPSINADTNDSFQKKEDNSDLTKESSSKQKNSNDLIKDVSFPPGLSSDTTANKQKDEKEAREQAAKEAEARQKSEKERVVREQAAKEAEAKRKEEKERAAKEQAAKEAEAKRKEETERAAREKAAREAEAKRKEEMERVARDKATKEAEAKRKEEIERVARDKAAKEAEAKRKEEKERAAKEAEAKRKEEKERAAREQAAKEAEAKQKEEKERAVREQAAKEAEAKRKEEKERAAREQAAKEAEAKRKEEDQKRKAAEKARRKAEREAKKKEEELKKAELPWWEKKGDDQKVEDALTKIEDVAEGLKNIDSMPHLKKTPDNSLNFQLHVEGVAEELKNIDSVSDLKKTPDKPLNSKLHELKNENSKSRSGSPLTKERQRKKSESLEKAEQWLRDRMDQKAKSSEHSRKTSESSNSLQVGNDFEQKKQANCQDTLSSHNKSTEDEKVIPESIPLVTQVSQTISQQQPSSSPFEPKVTTYTHWLQADLENEKPMPTNVMKAFSPPPEVPTRLSSPPNSTIPSRFRNMWQNPKTERLEPPTPSKESSISRRSSVNSKESSVPRRGSVFDHAANDSKRSSGADQIGSRRGSIMEHVSRFNTPFQSRQPSPSAAKSRGTSPEINGRPFHSTTDVLSRAKSINQLNGQSNASRKPSTSNGTDFNRSKSFSNDYKDSNSSSAFNKRGSTTEESRVKNETKPPVREFSPVILVRPSTFIQAMNPPPSPHARPKDYVNAPSSRDRSNQDRIPSRFRKAMSHNTTSNMTRSRSIHELHQESTSLEHHAQGLQDQIRQARAEHRKFFDDAQSHTTYNPNSRTARERMSAEWNRTASMRNLRASPSRDYRRL